VPLLDDASSPTVRGTLHPGDSPANGGIVLAHGAGGNQDAPVLVALATAFAERGVTTLRCDLPFRQARPTGPPGPGIAARDRAGLARALAVLRARIRGPLFLGGHSYGGRQASLLAAEQPDLVAGLLLSSYPLHPPRRAAPDRSAHFPALGSPVLFVHGTRDTFATLDELALVQRKIRARTALLPVEGAGHDLVRSRSATDLARAVVEAFLTLVG
jgi:predicted alpha/beta-hydrolase family hydrolase